MPAYTWATGETITATKLNTLETEAWRAANLLAYDALTSSFNTTSTSYVNITGLSVTFTTKSTSVLIGIFGPGILGSTLQRLDLGVRINSVDYTLAYYKMGQIDEVNMIGGIVQVTGLTANTSYTADARLRTSGSTAYFAQIQGGSGNSSMFVLDLSK
jgi:hypothetical protein